MCANIRKERSISKSKKRTYMSLLSWGSIAGGEVHNDNDISYSFRGVSVHAFAGVLFAVPSLYLEG